MFIHPDYLLCRCQHVLFTVKGLGFADMLWHIVRTDSSGFFLCCLHLPWIIFFYREWRKRDRESWEQNTSLCRETGVFLACQLLSHCAMAPVPLHHNRYVQHIYIILYYIVLWRMWNFYQTIIKPKRALRSKDEATMAGTNSTVERNRAQTPTSVGAICFDPLEWKENPNKAQITTLQYNHP